MICVLPNPTDRIAGQDPVQNGEALRPFELQQSDQPLLDWIAGELTESSGEFGPRERNQARRILKQAFAATTPNPNP
jgi:hypothetical protein